jgi:hypothetical protein
MLNSKTIASKLIGVSVAMVLFFGLTAQYGGKRTNYEEKRTNGVKKLYEKKNRRSYRNFGKKYGINRY